jgi:TRAP-type C4-dicarboxylate transport system permease small subunit
MRSIVARIDDAFCRGVEAIAVALLVAYAALCFYQIVVRFVINVPATWTEALIRALMIWSVYLGAVALFRRGLLVSVDFLHSISSGAFRRALEILHVLAALVVLGAASIFGFQLAWRVRFQVLAGVEVSIAFAYLAIPVGALLCIVALIARYLDPRPTSEPIPSD